MKTTTIFLLSTLLLASPCWSTPQQVQSSTPTVHELISKVFKPKSNIDGVNGNNGVLIETTSGSPKRTGGGGTDECECVPYYLCQNDTIIDDGVGLIDIRLSGPCDNYLDTCCLPPNIRTLEQKITPKPQLRKGCGKRNVNGVGFRISGARDGEAQYGEFPWMVAILKEEAVGNQGELLNVYQCGGALIHPSVVLTAAHCVNGNAATSLKIRAGEWDTQTKSELYPHQDRRVVELAIHENFHRGSLRSDFALLRLEQSVDIMETVDVACLPDYNTNFDYQRCFASGWGKNEFGKEGRYQVILKKIELPVVPRDSCQNSLRTTRLGRHFKLDRSFMCAGGEPGRDTCKGDGGSPLVCPVPGDPTRFYQAGIVAWGIGCGENFVPGVYADVAYARGWIDQKMAAWRLDNREYQYAA